MIHGIDYYLSVASPWTYLGGDRFAALAARHGAPVRVRPMDLDRVFAASGGLPFAQRTWQRQSYRQLELDRWRRHLGVPLTLEPRYYPVDRRPASCLVIAARERGFEPLELTQAILRGIWAEERNIASWTELEEIASAIGLPGAKLVEAAQQPDIGALFDAETAEAVEAGVFGAPSYAVDGELFWGQDRLDFVERKLERVRGAAASQA